MNAITTKRMKSESNEFSELSNRTIGCAIEVHRHLGPGLLESTYQRCLAYEFETNNIADKAEHPLPVIYQGIEMDCGYRLDFLAESAIILELKIIEKLLPIHEAQLLTYMKLAGIREGFLLNFNVKRLKDGLKRYVL